MFLETSSHEQGNTFQGLFLRFNDPVNCVRNHVHDMFVWHKSGLQKLPQVADSGYVSAPKWLNIVDVESESCMNELCEHKHSDNVVIIIINKWITVCLTC